MTGSDLELGGLQSIIYFIEIGLEKLTKDYIHCYLGMNYPSQDGSFCELVEL